MFELNSPLRKAKRKLILIEKIALFLSKTQGRDKLCKLLQYLFRFIAACYHIDTYKNTKYSSLYRSIKDARKIFRLFKSVNEYQGMSFILFNEEQSFINLLKLLSRACYFFYWAFDNISILAKIKLFRANFQKFYRIGYSFWFTALVFMNVALLIELFLEKNQTKRRIQSNEFQSQIPQNCTLAYDFEQKKQEQFLELSEEEKKKRRNQTWLKFLKNSLDMIPSGKDSKILEIIFNRVIPQKAAGVGGFISSMISIYQISRQINEATGG